MISDDCVEDDAKLTFMSEYVSFPMLTFAEAPEDKLSTYILLSSSGFDPRYMVAPDAEDERRYTAYTFSLFGRWK